MRSRNFFNVQVFFKIHRRTCDQTQSYWVYSCYWIWP